MWGSANLTDLSAADLDISLSPSAGGRRVIQLIPSRIRGELIRKSLHMLVAFLPSIAATTGVEAALALLSAGTLTYAISEYLRLNGHTVAVITPLTVLASRGRAKDGFVLGPVTLAVGAMLALLFYPAHAAALAVYALAFGDGVASLAGRAFGRIRILSTKTLEGSLACFVTVWFVTLLVTGRVDVALIIAGTATVLEILPADDMDNIILPMGVGFVATLLL